MTAEEFSATKSLWKFAYAEECFRRVAGTCEFILQNRISEDNPAYYPMIVAIYAVYGRPFKQTDVVGALSRNIVPAEFRPLHDVMIEHRDEVYMHTQPGRYSEVRVRVSYIGTSRTREAQLISTEFYALLLKLSTIIELCQANRAIVEQRRVKLQNRYFPKHLPKDEGEYPLNIVDRAAPFFLPKQPPLI